MTTAGLSASGTSGGPGSVPGTILLVDDNVTNLQVLRESIEGIGARILIAKSGAAALAIVEKTRPDLILLDIMMPGMDGYEVCRRLKGAEETRRIPIIFLTARAEIRDRAKGIDLGGVDYVTKPFNPVELAPLVQDLVRRVEGGERDDLRREKFAEVRELLERD